MSARRSLGPVDEAADLEEARTRADSLDLSTRLEETIAMHIVTVVEIARSCADAEERSRAPAARDQAFAGSAAFAFSSARRAAARLRRSKLLVNSRAIAGWSRNTNRAAARRAVRRRWISAA